MRGDRPAAGADGVDVERRQTDREPGDHALGRGLGRAAAHEADVGARAAHVEGDRVGEPAAGRRQRAAPGTPPAGPDSSSAAGSSAASPAGMSPPADVITSTSPPSRRPPAGTAGTTGRR